MSTWRNLDEDVPSPIDLRDLRDASEWVANADLKRPWRLQLREAFVELLRSSAPPPRRVLELGPGPGLLAETILRACTLENYTLLDFSAPMLDMCRQRLTDYRTVTFVLGDFKWSGWTESVEGPFDAVVAMQAVHEIRHKRYVADLYRRIQHVLRRGGSLLICDHSPTDETDRARALYSTVAEQHAAFSAAGFIDVRTDLVLHGMYLCRGRLPGGAA
jgi:ubiquinone/menaquinone biosynthesis C-methylase UbiE